MLCHVLRFVLAAFASATLDRAAPRALPACVELCLDTRVLTFNVILSVVAPIVFGLAPALGSCRAEWLHDRSDLGSRPTGWMRQGLVTAEVALSVVLVVGAGLLVRSLVRLEQVDPGFDAEQVLTFHLQLPPARYPDNAAVLRTIETIESRLRTLPQVRAVGATTTLALRGYDWS